MRVEIISVGREKVYGNPRVLGPHHATYYIRPSSSNKSIQNVQNGT